MPVVYADVSGQQALLKRRQAPQARGLAEATARGLLLAQPLAYFTADNSNNRVLKVEAIPVKAYPESASGTESVIRKGPQWVDVTSGPLRD